MNGNNKEVVLSVNNLAIDFKTDNGILKAVRDVSFELYRGETLCIVGESGSGKSVTSKTIMGILANNAIIAGGNIMYRGENLLEVSEEEFYKIRGHKIGMIFQDPLSSLNPIVRIGKQITEAMLINSDRLKLMYHDLISDDLIRYKNTLAKMNIAIDNEKKQLDAFIQQAESKEGVTKEEAQALKQEIKQKKAAFKQFVKDTKAKYADQAKEYKLTLDQTKKSAKAKVAEYKKQLKLNELKGALSRAKGEEAERIKQEIEKENESFVTSQRITKAEAKKKALEIMREVGIPEPERRYRQYPFEFSGGMRQRIVIAIALTASPEILICDEPTTALDVTIQAQILELINRIKAERN